MNSKQQVSIIDSADLQTTEKVQEDRNLAENSEKEDLDASFHSARSTTETLAMRLDAAPFDPKAILQSESQSVIIQTDQDAELIEETEVQKQLKF